MSKAGLTGAGGLAGMLITGVGILDLKVAAEAWTSRPAGWDSLCLYPIFSFLSYKSRPHVQGGYAELGVGEWGSRAKYPGLGWQCWIRSRPIPSLVVLGIKSRGKKLGWIWEPGNRVLIEGLRSLD